MLYNTYITTKQEYEVAKWVFGLGVSKNWTRGVHLIWEMCRVLEVWDAALGASFHLARVTSSLSDL